MEKEIIGYKLKNQNVKMAVRAILNNDYNRWFDENFDRNLRENGWNFKKSSGDYGGVDKDLEKAGVLNLWFKPVYKKNKPFFKVYILNNGILEKHLPRHKFDYLTDVKNYFETLHVKYGRKEFQVIVQKYYGTSGPKIVGVYDFEYKGNTTPNQFKRI